QGTDWSMGGWRGLMLPIGVPEERVEVLQAAIQRVVERDDYVQFMESSGFDHTTAPPSEFEALLARTDDQFGAILTSDAFRSVQRARYGPSTFPAILAVLLAMTVLALIASGGFRRPPEMPPMTTRQWIRVGLTVLWILAFVVLLEPLGF